jgi:hypothetical protein
MPKDPQRFAELFGAKLVGEVPDVGDGPFGMARLAHLLHRRLTPGQGERPGRPTDPAWEARYKVPMSRATLRQLTDLACSMSSPARQVSPMQLAAQLLEEALARVGAKTEIRAEEAFTDPAAPASSEGVKARPKSRKTPPQHGPENGTRVPRRRKKA